MRLRILGCGGGIGNGRRTTTLLVNENLLIDAGTGVSDLTMEAMCLIRHIFFTHSHLDHVTCMPFLADTVFSRSKHGIKMYGLSETLGAVRTHILNGTIWPDFTVIPPKQPLLSYRPVALGEKIPLDRLEVTVIPVNHSVPGVGYLVDDGQHAFAFSGDTSTNETFWNALNAHPRLDLLIVEVGFPNEQEALAKISGHYTATLLARDIAQLRHRVPIYITHMKPGLEDQIMLECREQMPEYNLAPLADRMIFEFPYV